MEVASPRLGFNSLCLHGPAGAEEDLTSSVFSDLSDSTGCEEEHTQKARRFSGTFRSSGPAAPPLELPRWSPSDSAALYGVPGWGADYFSIDESTGTLLVKPEAGAATCRRRQGVGHAVGSAPAKHSKQQPCWPAGAAERSRRTGPSTRHLPPANRRCLTPPSTQRMAPRSTCTS